MKIGINALFTARGGSLTNLIQLLDSWRVREDVGQHEIIVFCSPHTASRIQSFIVPGWKCIVLQCAAWGLPGRLLAEQMFLPLLLPQHRLDVLFCPANTVPLAVCVPCVVTFQNAAPYCETVTPGSVGFLNWIRFRSIRPFIRMSVWKATRIIFISEHFKKLLLGRYLLTEDRTAVISRARTPAQALELDCEVVRRLGIEGPYLLCVSHLYGYKNILELIRAFHIVRNREPAFREKLVLVGEAPLPGYLERIRFLMRELKLDPEDVVLTGGLPHADTLALLRCCDIFVFPSTCENCPTGLIEALEAGVAIACSDAGGLAEIAGEAAVYFDSHHPESIASAIFKLHRDLALRENLSCKAKIQVQRFPTASQMADATWKVLADACKKVRGRPGIRVLTEIYYPEETSTGYLLTRIAEGLAREFPVEVLTGPSMHADREYRHGVHILRCGGTSFAKDSIPGRLCNTVTRTLSMLWAGLRRCRRGDVLFVVTNPPLLPFAARLICACRGARYVLLVHDVYPEALVASGLVRSDSLLVWTWDWLGTKTLCAAEKIVSLGRDMTGRLASKPGVNRSKIRLIPNWAELEGVSPSVKKEAPWIRELQFENVFTILLAGNLGRTHDPAMVTRAAEILKGRKDVHFLVAGFGAKSSWLMAEIDSRGLKNVTFHQGPYPREKQGEILGACDVALIPMMSGMNGVSVPSRMYNLMAAGRPMIAVTEPEAELARVIVEEKIGWVVKPGDADGLVKAILEAKMDPSGLLGMGVRARCAAVEKYSESTALEAYRNLFREWMRTAEGGRA